MSQQLPANILTQIEEACEFYRTQIPTFNMLAKTLLNFLVEDRELSSLIHFSKYRVKEVDHLKVKLVRIATQMVQKEHEFAITKDNLFSAVNDLAGIRLLHLYSKQMGSIHSGILRVLKEQRYKVVGKPVAYTWDIENKARFKALGLKVEDRPSLYTSVHYDVRNNSRTDIRCEIQVRTIMEEVFGEVSHRVDYPTPVSSIACAEQIKVLARVVSGCTRLVDSIFNSYDDHLKMKQERLDAAVPLLENSDQSVGPAPDSQTD